MVPRAALVFMSLLLLLLWQIIVVDGRVSSSASSSSGASAAAIKNGHVTEVTSLPGWPSETPLPTKTFSGFIDLSNSEANIHSATNNTSANNSSKMLMHYILYLSENDPSTDPVIVWYNGGPGASSAWGLFVENGPLLLNAGSLVSGSNGSNTSGGDIHLLENPYSWTKFASIVAFANPPPVGFSFCSPPGPAGNGTACGTWNDTRVGIANADAIDILFNDHFPTLIFNKPDHQFFIIGESYAGVYIGETGMAMLRKPDRYAKVLRHLGGIALGDACLGTDVLCGGDWVMWYHMLFMYGHGQFPTTMYKEMMFECGGEEGLKKHGTSSFTGKCKDVLNRIHQAVGGYFAYNLYDQCPHNAFLTVSDDASTGSVPKRLSQAHEHKTAASRHRRPLQHEERSMTPLQRINKQKKNHKTESTNVNPLEPVPLHNGYWCPEQVFFNYMNRDDVRKALNVPLDSNFFSADDGHGMNYVYNSKTVMPFFTALIENTTGVINHPVRVVAYEGDADPAVNIFIVQDVWYNFANSSGYSVKKNWSHWTFGENIVAGYDVQWADGLLSFVSIRGSGHMVPEYKPLSAQVFAESFVTGQSLPSWEPQHRSGRSP